VTEYLFLYGTLLPKFAPAELRRTLKRLRWTGEAQVRGRLYDLGEFPGAILDASSESQIRGEVFSFSDDSVLEILDSYEEFDPENTEQSLFIRTKVAATLPVGRILDCWVYVYNRNPQNASILPDGDYSQFAAIRHPRPHS